MAQTLYWVVQGGQAYANTPADAQKIKDHVQTDLTPIALGNYGSQPYTVPGTIQGNPATNLIPSTSYRIAWTIQDDSTLVFGGGSSTYVSQSAFFNTNPATVISGISIQGFSLGATSTATLGIAASSTQGFVLGATSTATLGIAAASTQGFTLAYSSTGTVSQPVGTISGVSTQGFLLGYVSQAVIPIGAGSSTQAFTLGYASQAVVGFPPVQAVSTQGFVLSNGGSVATEGITAGSNKPLNFTAGAVSTATVSQPVAPVLAASTQPFALGRTSTAGIQIATTSIRSFTLSAVSTGTVSQLANVASSIKGFALGGLSQATTGGLVPGKIGHIGGDDAPETPWPVSRVLIEMEDRMLLETVLLLHTHGLLRG